MIGPIIGRPLPRLFLTSTALLFVELFLIRWIPANVVYVGFFTNFLLIASFLGIGLGILLGRRFEQPKIAPFPLLLFAVVKLVTVAQLNVRVGSEDDILIGPAALTGAADANVLVLVLVMALATAVMTALALPLGRLLKAAPPLQVYATDIAGSLTGIAAFTLLSANGTSPGVWMLVLGGLVGALGVSAGLRPWSALSAAAMVGAVVVAGATSDVWSPYQRITLFETPTEYGINVNGIPHQEFSKDPANVGFFYTQIDRWFPNTHFDRTLIVGAGNGVDTSVALRRGDGHVDAVEIDPGILAIGREKSPSDPYDDARVTTIVDDGRNVLRNARDSYDLVVFAMPDSLTLFSTANAIRLESFLFTSESFEAVRDHLTPNGVFVLYNFYWQPWLIDRLGSMLQTTFGDAPAVSYYDQFDGHAAVLAAGPRLAAAGGIPPGGGELLKLSYAPGPTTDNWPFLYLRQPEIASYYLIALSIMFILGALAVLGAAKATGLSPRRFSPHFFVLGSAFLLLESRSLVTFGLLFGNTWLVNALVFFAILVSVLAGIAISARLPRRKPGPLYFALFASLALAWLLPPDALLVAPPALRYLIAGAVAFAPVFFANLCFTYSFRETDAADMAFASNLLGAVAGGALEYLALLTGYQALLVVIAALYLLALTLGSRVRLLSDRDIRTAITDAQLSTA